ncbi:MAG: dihydrofolate reductase family protein [Desulfobacterales bacterium]|nr:dihydrofolate reductase family protein [Desulfobacterales bacterium]MDJ0854362.1 dihydrofolate reductase family protein [Desulfobacterales bacterium]MDJ0888911.1 dihydrofolate reductase family protein [Desulfobacterales bacterium]MDJ0990912.1 dihydrofolate reductase family protein [Desulfobacterales bacterium]
MAIKTILLMALTLDGKIAKDSDHFPDWTGKADKRLFVEITKAAGALIMGSKTFDTIGKPLPGRKNIVMTRDPRRISTWDNLVYTNLTPQALLAELESEGYREVVLAGGTRINSIFLRAGLIDELIVTITPMIFGSGIGLFEEGIEVDLVLEEFRPLDEARVCLHYRVV